MTVVTPVMYGSLAKHSISHFVLLLVSWKMLSEIAIHQAECVSKVNRQVPNFDTMTRDVYCGLIWTQSLDTTMIWVISKSNIFQANFQIDNSFIQTYMDSFSLISVTTFIDLYLLSTQINRINVSIGPLKLPPFY